MLTVAIIEARANSKRLPGKHMASICGASLISRVIESATESSCDHVIVSSNDDEILSEAARCNAEWHERPAPLCVENTETSLGDEQGARDSYHESLVRRMYGVKEFVMVNMMGNSLFMKDGLLDECLESYLGSSPIPELLRLVAKMTHQHPMYSIRLGEGDELVWDHPSSHPYPTRGGEMPPRYYPVSGPRIYTAGSDERGFVGIAGFTLVKALVIGTNDIVHIDDTDDLLLANALWRESRPKRIVSDLTGLPEIIGATP